MGHPCPEVALPALGFWSKAGRDVLAVHTSATAPLLQSCVAACTYPRDMGERDDEYAEVKADMRAAARRLAHDLVRGDAPADGGSADDGGSGGAAAPSTTVAGMAPHVLAATAGLVESCAAAAHALCRAYAAQGLPPAALPPSPPPANDPIEWQPLEASLHVLCALAPALAARDAPTMQLMCSPVVRSLVEVLPTLPPRRALWREATLLAAELALAIDSAQDAALQAALLCTTAAARTLSVSEGGDETADADEPFEFTRPSAGDSAPPVHAGASALWRLCSGSAVAAAGLAAAPGVFDGILAAYQACAPAEGVTSVPPKAACLLKVLCALARASASPQDDFRTQQLCMPLVNVLRSAQAAAAGGTGAATPAAAAAATSVALHQLTVVARHAGRVQPGPLGLLAAEWPTIRSVTIALNANGSVAHSTCRLLSVALTHAEGAVRGLVEAAAQLTTELHRPIASPTRPMPCVLEPLTAALRRVGTPAATGGAAGEQASALPVDAPLEAGLVGWLEGALAAFLPSLSAPSTPTGVGSDAAPIDLTDDDEEALAAVCDVLSAGLSVLSVPRIVDVAATAALPLLCGSAAGLRATERDAARAALTLARGLLTAPPHPTLQRLLHQEQGGMALALGLLNAAGGAMPSYLQDDVALACRTLFTAQPEVGAAWVQAAVNSPSFAHPHINGEKAVVPTGGNRSMLLANYAMVLQYLASHKAWDHFATVLLRGVAVSEAADDDDEEGDDLPVEPIG